jgi:hypothetical protein
MKANQAHNTVREELTAGGGGGIYHIIAWGTTKSGRRKEKEEVRIEKRRGKCSVVYVV